ncbi:MAG: hypothetical protein AMJ69_10035, partial [Gammaproteobacteria bacterium SG8_47]
GARRQGLSIPAQDGEHNAIQTDPIMHALHDGGDHLAEFCASTHVLLQLDQSLFQCGTLGDQTHWRARGRLARGADIRLLLGLRLALRWHDERQQRCRGRDFENIGVTRYLGAERMGPCDYLI